MATAYLVIFINRATLRVAQCGIFSEPSPTCLYTWKTMVLSTAEGGTWTAACKRMEANLDDKPELEWAKEIPLYGGLRHEPEPEPTYCQCCGAEEGA